MRGIITYLIIAVCLVATAGLAKADQTSELKLKKKAEPTLEQTMDFITTILGSDKYKSTVGYTIDVRPDLHLNGGFPELPYRVIHNGCWLRLAAANLTKAELDAYLGNGTVPERFRGMDPRFKFELNKDIIIEDMGKLEIVNYKIITHGERKGYGNGVVAAMIYDTPIYQLMLSIPGKKSMTEEFGSQETVEKLVKAFNHARKLCGAKDETVNKDLF